MGIEDNSLFEEFDRASERLAWRKLAFERAKTVLADAHPLFQHAKRQLEEAEAAVDAVIAKATSRD
jgi:hypothetical protein